MFHRPTGEMTRSQKCTSCLLDDRCDSFHIPDFPLSLQNTVPSFAIQFLQQHFSIWVFPKMGVPQNGWLIMEIPINPWMIWGYQNPLFLETSGCGWVPGPNHFAHGLPWGWEDGAGCAKFSKKVRMENGWFFEGQWD